MRSLLLPNLVVPVLVLSAGPVSAAPVEPWTDVQHNVAFTETFPDDVCGPRANTTTFTRKVEQTHLIRRANGTFSYHDVAVVTYVSDYADPTLPDLFGRLTEVNHRNVTPGEVFIATTTFRDFYGDIRIG